MSEGERVATGQALAVVTVPRATVADGDTMVALERRLQQRHDGLQSALAAQRRLFSAQSSGQAAQSANAQRELAQVEMEIATRRNQVRIANETLGRLRQLQDDKYVSLIQIKQQESAALEQVGAVQALQRLEPCRTGSFARQRPVARAVLQGNCDTCTTGRHSLRPAGSTQAWDADILGEQRRLIEWIFEPLYSLKGQVFDR